MGRGKRKRKSEVCDLRLEKSIKEINLPEGASIGAVVRHGELIMPESEVELCLNDHLIIFLANKDMMSEVEVLFKKS